MTLLACVVVAIITDCGFGATKKSLAVVVARACALFWGDAKEGYIVNPCGLEILATNW